jgi:protein AaeX
MRFNEINLFGLYVAPIAVILGIAWLVFVILRRTTNRFSPFQHVWHPALFELSVYVIIVSSIVLVMARWGL